MPYRRLPNTDQARIKALTQIINKGDEEGLYELPYSMESFSKAQSILQPFKNAHDYYTQCYSIQAKASPKHIANTHKARIYISHFIQVLNLAVQRMEIKKETKLLYGLQPDNYSIPDLSSEQSLIEWGKKIIDGENNRVSKGGIPIYSPTIARVSVYYDIFAESYEQQKAYQQQTSQSLKALTLLRPTIDAIILETWNQIEKKFSNIEDTEARLNKCRSFGVVYYYRKEEKKNISV